MRLIVKYCTINLTLLFCESIFVKIKNLLNLLNIMKLLTFLGLTFLGLFFIVPRRMDTPLGVVPGGRLLEK